MRGTKKSVKWAWRKKSTTTPLPPPPWVELPRDITANILQRLGVVEILESAQKVCRTWWIVCHNPAMWRKIDLSVDSCFPPNFDMEITCLHAVDRSEGQLLDMRIYGFGSDLLLEHITDRSSQLKYLTLGYCNGMTSHGVLNAIRKLHLLEGIHFAYITGGCEFIEQIGFCRPNLKSFAMNQARSSFQQSDDSEALAIAKTMPGLLHLSLVGNQMSNEGLKAILDSCTHLESLDLRMCFGVNLKGDLVKRCQRLKALKTPNERAGEFDYEELEVDEESDGFTDWVDSDIESEREYGSDEVDRETDCYDSQMFGLTEWLDSDTEISGEFDSVEDSVSEMRGKLEIQDLLKNEEEGRNEEEQAKQKEAASQKEVVDTVVGVITLPSEDGVSGRRRKLEIVEAGTADSEEA